MIHRYLRNTYRALILLSAGVAVMATSFGDGTITGFSSTSSAPTTVTEGWKEKVPLPRQRSTGPESFYRGGAGTWEALGPGPIQDGQVENVVPNDEVVGAVHAIAAHPTDADILYVAAVNGGVWRTNNATAGSPNWTPLTDDLTSLSTSAIAFDPTDGTHQTLLVGIGRYSSFAQAGGALNGLLRTDDGGASWTELNHSTLIGQNMSGVVARGATLVAASNYFFGGGGLFRSTVTGISWTTISGSNGLPTGAVLDLVGDPTDLDRLYASVRSDGIYRSDDGGLSWANISSGDASLTGIIQLAPFGTNNNTEMAVASDGRLYVGVLLSGRTRYIGYTDNPVDPTPSWTRMDLALTPEGSASSISDATNASPIEIESSNHGLSNRDFVFIEGVTGNTAANGVFVVSVVDSDHFTLDASSGSGSYTGGGMWTEVRGLNPKVKPGGQGSLHYSMAIDPLDPKTIYMGGDRQNFPSFIGATDFSGRLFRGDTLLAPTGTVPSPQWEHLTHLDSVASIPGGGTASSSSPHADSRDMTFDANGNLLEASDGGIYRRTSPQDNTGDWFSIIGNLQTTELHDVAYDTNSDIALGGAQDTGTPQQITTGGAAWDSVSTADGGDVVVDITSQPGFSTRYSSFQNLGGFRRRTYDSDNVLISQSFPTLSVGGGGSNLSAQFVTPLAVNEINGLRIVIGGSNSVYESMNQGDNILEIGPGIRASSLVYGGRSGGIDNEDVLYVGAGSSVYIRTSSGGSLVEAVSYPGGSVRDVALDAKEWKTGFVVDSNQVFRTQNTGGSWADVTGNLLSLGADFRTIEFIPGMGGSDAIVVGTTMGVFISQAPGYSNWSELGVGLPNAPVRDLDFDPADQVLVAGTMGRGAWIFRTPPTLNTILPTLGELRGGTTVTLQGANFSPGVDVMFGASEATVLSRSSTEIVVATPPGPGENVSVEVVVDQAGGTASLPAGYTYSPNLPALEHVGGAIRLGGTPRFMMFGESGQRCVLLADAQQGSCVLGGITLDLECTPQFRIVYNAFPAFGGVDAPLSSMGTAEASFTIPNNPNLLFRSFHVQSVIENSGAGLIVTSRQSFTILN